MSVLSLMRTIFVLVFAIGFWVDAQEPAAANPQSCDDGPPKRFDVREDPFNMSAAERFAVMDVIHAFALNWDLRDAVNLPLLFIEGDDANDSLRFLVCTSAGGVGQTGGQVIAAGSRQELTEYFETGPFQYVEDNTIQARHFISNAVIKSDRSGDARVTADLLVTLQHYDVDDEEGSLPIVDYTGMIVAILTKEWGGVWKIRKLTIYMDVPLPAEDVIFRGR